MNKTKKTQKPKSYWELLIKEVTEGNPNSKLTHSSSPSSTVVTYEANYERRSIKYRLGEPFSTYFTQREAECIIQLLNGKTMNEAGEVLHLSPRTVEYYLGKIKRKLNCRKKREVIQLVSQTEFVKNFKQDPYNQKSED
jgi:DNA-binding CsgD family transcriptional regulator